MQSNKQNCITPGDSLIVIGTVGLKGTSIMADKGRHLLKEKYDSHFIDAAAASYSDAKEVSEELSEELSEALTFDSVEEGGIYAALWKLSVRYHIGFDVDIFKIPVSVYTIEISNFFDINPYELLSGKCVLAVATCPEALIRHLRAEGYEAEGIGTVCAGQDKIVRHQEGALCLRPAKDSIEKFKKEFYHV